MEHELLSNDTKQAFVSEFKAWLSDKSCREPINILITGKTGVGKSRLVNALVGKKVAKEGRAKDPCTSEVTSYKQDIEGVTVTVWDSPGLQDGTKYEDRYIEDMKRKIKDVALMIYCIKMDDTRFYDVDKKAIRILTEEFGKEVWENAVLALTFANKVEDPDGEDDLEYFQYQLREWKKQFTDHLANVVSRQECKLIPVIPVGNVKSMRLPDRENWLSDLWTECYHVMKASARRGMYRINRHRLTSKVSSPSAAYQNAVSCNGIPTKIPLNKQQEESFWESTADAFVTFAKGTSEVVSAVVGAAVGFGAGLVTSVAETVGDFFSFFLG